MRSETSNSIRIQEERCTISPLIRHSFLLSSSTVFRFSIQAGSAGPSRMIHFRSWLVDVAMSLLMSDNEPLMTRTMMMIGLGYPR